MPASGATFAAVAALLEGVDVADEEAVEAFYVDVFPRYAPAVRSLIADWMATRTIDATRQDLEDLIAILREQGDYLAKSRDNPFYSQANTRQFAD